MESDVRSVTEEMKNYFAQITRDINNNASLTTIQNNEYQKSIINKYKAEGITYCISPNEDIRYSRICFQSPPWDINDVGTIVDVSEKGAFPLSLFIDDNISVRYDPRKLNDRDSSIWIYMDNRKFIHIKKGSEFEFQGRITYCDYYYNVKPNGRYEFYITEKGGWSFMQFIHDLLQ